MSYRNIPKESLLYGFRGGTLKKAEPPKRDVAPEKFEREYYKKLEQVADNLVKTFEADTRKQSSTSGRIEYMGRLEGAKAALASVRRGLESGRFIFTPREKGGLKMVEDYVENQATSYRIKRAQEHQAVLAQIPREAAAKYLELHPVVGTKKQWDRTSFFQREQYEKSLLSQLELEAKQGTGRFANTRPEIDKVYEALFPNAT